MGNAITDPLLNNRWIRRSAVWGAVFVLGLTASAGASQATTSEDTVAVVSMTPEGALPAGTPVRIALVIDVTLQSVDQAELNVGFNENDPLMSRMVQRVIVRRGTQRVNVSADVVPADWGDANQFAASINIFKPSGSMSLTVLAGTFHPIPVLGRQSSASASSAKEFLSGTPSIQMATLERVGRGQSGMPLDDLIEIVRAGALSAAPDIRLAAMRAAAGSFLAQKPVGSAADTERFRVALRADLLQAFRGDANEEVRREAFGTFGVFDAIDHRSYSADYLDLAAAAFRTDSSATVRMYVVVALTMATTETPTTRAVLIDAFADPDPLVRQAALLSLSPRDGGGVVLSYGEVRSHLVNGVKDSDGENRVIALEAAKLLAGAAREMLPLVEAIAERDPVQQIRDAAGRVAATIRVDSRP